MSVFSSDGDVASGRGGSWRRPGAAWVFGTDDRRAIDDETYRVPLPRRRS